MLQFHFLLTLMLTIKSTEKMNKDTIPEAIKLSCLFFLPSWETSDNTYVALCEHKG